MPYVKKEQRKYLDVIVKSALKIYKDSGRLYWDYILIKLAERFIEPGYNRYKNFLAEITESAFEMERRFKITSEDAHVGGRGIFIPTDAVLRGLNNFIEDLVPLDFNGDLNYILFAFGVRMDESNRIKRTGNVCRENYILQLKQTVAWIRKHILAPYEDKKIKENGDIK